MSTSARAWRLNNALRDAKKVCALTKVGNVLNAAKTLKKNIQTNRFRDILPKKKKKIIFIAWGSVHTTSEKFENQLYFYC